MSYTAKHIPFILCLVIVLASCTDTPRPVTQTPVPLHSTATPIRTSVLTSTPTPAIFHLDRSSLAYGIFETEATVLTIDVSNTAPGQFKDFTDISVADGTGLTTYQVGEGASTIVHSMQPGKKRVTVTAGLQTKFRNRITGVFITRIAFNGSTVHVEEERKRILIYGDSLAVGGNVEHVSAEAWPVLLRKYFSVRLEAYGYRALHDDAATSEARAGFAAGISAWKPDIIWLAIGANDYAFDRWPARQFGEAYAATLDRIHAASSGARVYAQSPILRADESPNSFGETLAKYRQEIAAACQARPGWCVFVDGTLSAFPQPTELDRDGIHLTTKSSLKYAEAVRHIIDK